MDSWSILSKLTQRQSQSSQPDKNFIIIPIPIHPEKKVKVNEENFIELFKIFFSNEKNIIFSGSTPPSSWTKSNMKADKDENKQILKSDSELFILLYDFFLSLSLSLLLYGMRQQGLKTVRHTVILFSAWTLYQPIFSFLRRYLHNVSLIWSC